MKKALLLSILLFLAFVSISSAQTTNDCKFAWPQMGVVKCNEMGANAYNTYVWDKSKATLNDPYYTFALTCISHCTIDSKQNILSAMKCPSNFAVKSEVAKITDGTGTTTYTIKGDGSGNFPSSLIWEHGQTVTIKEYCSPIFLSDQLLDIAGVTWKENKIALYETTADWPEHKIDGSDGCLMHALVQQVSSAQVVSGKVPPSWIDTEGNVKDTTNKYKTKFVSNINQVTTNLETGDSISYFYKWIEVPGINVAIDRQGNPTGYCGGSVGNRKFYNYNQLTAQDGTCYLIPTSIQKTVECCYPADCILKAPGLTCDTSTHTCSDKKPCDSDLECQADTGTCVTKTKTDWTCNLNEPWYPKKGTCEKTTATVDCCTSEDCKDTSIYVCSSNKCITRQDLLSCPIGQCCATGGKYLPQECSAGQECCKSEGSLVGQCKESCKPVTSTTDSSLATGVPPSNTALSSTQESIGSILPTVGIIFIVALIGGAAYFFYLKPKEGQTSSTQIGTMKCPKCNSIQKSSAQFCNSCGQKIK